MVLSRRQRIILRQIVRPPYIYRWAGLLTATGMFLGATAIVLTDTGVSATLAAGIGSPTVAEGALARPAGPPNRRGAPAAGVAQALPAIVPSILTATGSGRRVVALTFDDGPEATYTPEILDLLARHDIQATFCMIGQQAVAHPELVRRIVGAGHRLCNHTFTHDAGVGTRPPDMMDRQLRASRDAVARAAGPGVPVDYFRAPEGKWSAALEHMSARDGMRPLGWSVDTLDWTQPGTAAIVTSVQEGVRPGSVVLFHDGGGPRDQTVEALRELIPWLREQGYQFVLPT